MKKLQRLRPGRLPQLTNSWEAFEPQTIIAHITITRPDFSEGSKVWRFRLGDRTVSIDVSESTIPHEVHHRGYVRIGDTWKVRLQMTERKTAAGTYVNDYKVLEVLEFIPGNEQLALGLIDRLEGEKEEEEEKEQQKKLLPPIEES